MASNKTVLHFGPGQADPSPLVSRFAEENGLELVSVEHASDVRALLNRTMPACLLIETDSWLGRSHQSIPQPPGPTNP